jgi:hypothetical protein
VNTWKRIAGFFEDGDLVPFAVVVSAVHYVAALVAYGGEYWPVAVLVGVFVDMLHYRTVRYAVRGKQRPAVFLAIATTAMSYAFHLLFYVDGGGFEPVYLLLAAPLPFGIFILAWQQEQARAIDDTAQRLATAESRVTELESKVKDGETKLKESETRRKELDRQVKAATAPLQAVNPLAQDIIAMMAGDAITQAEIATRHGVSESTVSRVKSTLNGSK